MRRLAPLACLGLAACSRNPSAVLDPAGPHARVTGDLFWFLLIVNGLIWIAVLGVLFVSLVRNRTAVTTAPAEPAPATEQVLTQRVAVAVIATVLMLTLFVGVSYAVDRKLIAFDRGDAVTIEVTGHQWWWELRYSGALPSDTFVTANEIHVPVGRKVRLTLRSTDVIHSMWIPNLAGKRDIIPGHDQELVFEADKPGRWYGRCAEFCGLEHAYMGIVVIAEPPAKFDAWQAAQRLPAPAPLTAEAQYGQQVFTSSPCGMCHTIRGTDAAGYSSTAPDLTHLMSRTTIAAATVPNATGYLGGWIVDPHGIKPGVQMPTIQQNSKDYQALLAYLGTLK